VVLPALIAAFAGGLTLPNRALAQTTSLPGSIPQERAGSSSTAVQQAGGQLKPTLTSADAIRIARTDPKVAEQRRRYGSLSPSAQAKPGTWQVDFYAHGAERVQVIVD